MNTYHFASCILSASVLLGYLNYRFVRLQPTIAIMAASLLLSLSFLVAEEFGLFTLSQHLREMVHCINFHDLLMNGMLSFLLFAGSLHVDFNFFKRYKAEIGVLAFVSTILSAVIVGYASFFLLPYLGLKMPLIYCFLFGALISPTDPIAVLATLKEVSAPTAISIKMAGESLYNDGVGIVIFTVIYQLLFSHQEPTVSGVINLFMRQAVGGILYGIALGISTYKMLQSIDEHKLEVLLTLVTVTAGYAFAQHIGVSGPLAMVVAGMFVGNRGRHFSMSDKSRQSLDTFWELIDEVLNAVLFLLIGLELIVLDIGWQEVMWMVFAIVLLLVARSLTVMTPLWLMRNWKRYDQRDVNVLIWGGLRGGLAVALALAIPQGNPVYRHGILIMTYAVVVFAIIVQGISVKRMVKKYYDPSLKVV